MKPGGQKGNKNAVKDDGKKATSHLHIRVTPQQKAAWVHAAGGRKLSEWVIDALNQKAGAVMITFSEMQRMSKIFADEIGWDGQNFTKPDRKEFHKLGADFIKNHPEVIEVLMPGGGSFDSVDDYVAHVESSGRSIEEHVASKLFCVAAQ